MIKANNKKMIMKITKKEFVMKAIINSPETSINKLESLYIELQEKWYIDKPKAKLNNKNEIVVVNKYTKEDFELQTAVAFIKHKLQTVKWQTFFKWKDMNKIEQEWADEVRKLIKIDCLTKEQITEICSFAVNDTFRKNNILSMNKFRTKNKDWVYIWAMIADLLITNWQKEKENEMILV